MEETNRNQVKYKVCQMLVNAIEKNAAGMGAEYVGVRSGCNFKQDGLKLNRMVSENFEANKKLQKKISKHPNQLSIISEYTHTHTHNLPIQHLLFELTFNSII